MDELNKLCRLLLRRLVRRGSTPHDAEDALQQAFVRLYSHQKKEPIRDPSAFLVDVLGKVRVEGWRSAQRQRQLFVAEPIEQLKLVDLAPTPEEHAQADQQLERIRRRLEALGPRTQQIFLLHRIEGLSYAQIAAAIGVSVSAIEKHIARAALCIHEEGQRE